MKDKAARDASGFAVIEAFLPELDCVVNLHGVRIYGNACAKVANRPNRMWLRNK
jgi:hypothetical protein